MKNYNQFINDSMNEKRTTYDFGCAMVYFSAPEISKIQEQIDPADIHENGLESEPHTTLLYGLHSADIQDDQVMEICTGVTYTPIKLHNPSIFENKDFDVLKFDAECEELQTANGELIKLPHTTDYPDYHPHATIAYLMPGTGEKYSKMFEGAFVYAVAEEIVYSKPDGSKIRKKL
jgi:hypothetical protein